MEERKVRWEEKREELLQRRAIGEEGLGEFMGQLAK